MMLTAGLCNLQNRVIGMEYWLNDQGRDLHPDTVIVMADADFVLYAPLHKAFQDRNGASVVQHGQPAGQIYLIGSQWFKQRGCAEWMREQCGEACGDNTAEAVDLHYMVGAPLAMTKACPPLPSPGAPARSPVQHACAHRHVGTMHPHLQISHTSRQTMGRPWYGHRSCCRCGC